MLKLGESTHLSRGHADNRGEKTVLTSLRFKSFLRITTYSKYQLLRIWWLERLQLDA